MNQLTAPDIVTRRPQTIDEVSDQLAGLDQSLTGTHLAQLGAFNHTYRIITRRVAHTLGHGIFGNDRLIEQLDTAFVTRYTQPLRSYLAGRRIPTAWHITFETCAANTSFGFIAMALGVNAHVNHDLPRVLAEIAGDDNFETDFLAINEIIRASLDEVITSLHETNGLIDAAEHQLKHQYEFLLQDLIQSWRTTAWQQSRALRAGLLPLRAVTRRATQIARLLASVKRLDVIANELLS